MEQYKGSAAYDQEDFFNQFIKRRHRDQSPNKLIENPSFFELLGDVKGKKMLDLGCGDGTLAIDLHHKNYAHYTGVDGSENMCSKAYENAKHTNSTIVHSSLHTFEYPPNHYDIVVSQLVFHYIENIDTLFKNVYETLKDGGRFVFSVQHPLLTASFKSASGTGKRNDWIVDDYFNSGKRVEPWIGEQVVKYHRTTEAYFIALQQAGFKITGLREATPQKENFHNIEEYERRMKIPLFLLFSCTK
jgi:ubiquinone/menaquinone biosynthesis C-methylase UbiE